MTNDGRIDVTFEVLLYQDTEGDRMWRAISSAPYVCQSDYHSYEWADVVEAVLAQIKKEAGKLVKAGYSIRVNFVPAYLSKDDKIIRSGYQNVICVRSADQ